MTAFGYVTLLIISCILCVTGLPTNQLPITSKGRSVVKKPEVLEKTNDLTSSASSKEKLNITEDVIERMLPYEAEEAIVTKERMDVSKWGRHLPKIKAHVETARHRKDSKHPKKNKRKGKGRRTSSSSTKGKTRNGRRSHRNADLRKKKKRFHKKSELN